MAIVIKRTFWTRVRGAAAALFAQGTTDPDAGVALQADESDGALHVKAVGMQLPVGGAAPSTVVGTPGRLNQDWAETFDTAPSVIGTWHPLVHGASVAATIGAGPVTASAVGRAVTINSIIVGVTTLAQIRAAIAADAAPAALLTLAGDGTVDAAYVAHAAHDLWASGTIPATMLMGLYPDGYIWPLEVDATGGAKVSLSSLLFGEDGARNVMRVEHQGVETGRKVASDVVVAVGTPGRLYGMLLEAGAGGMTLNLRKDGVVGGAIITQFVLAANTYDPRILPDVPYGNGLYAEIAAGGGAYNFLARNG